MKIIAILIFFLPISLFSQSDKGEMLDYGKKYTLKSKVLNEDRTYWVRVPSSYNNTKHAPQKYPVMYVLDGKSVFFPLAGVVSFMSEKESVNFQIPEMIIVGIDTENRFRDLTPNESSKQPDGSEPKTEAQKLMMKGSGGGEAFFKFLTQELFPKIETEYRTIPYRIYVGHSLGGLTSSYTLLQHAGVFDGYLAIDPSLWWDGAKYVNEAPSVLKQYPTSKVQRYYVSVVDTIPQNMGMNFHISSIQKMAKQLSDNAPKNLKWQLDVIPNTDHSSIPLISWYNGLKFIFEGYDVSHYAFMQNPDMIETHYADLEKNIGLKMSPPEDVFEILIHYLTSPNRFPDAAKALKVVKMALKYHPDSPFLKEKLSLLEKK